MCFIKCKLYSKAWLSLSFPAGERRPKLSTYRRIASWAQQPNPWLVRSLRPFPEDMRRRFFCAPRATQVPPRPTTWVAPQPSTWVPDREPGSDFQTGIAKITIRDRAWKSDIDKNSIIVYDLSWRPRRTWQSLESNRQVTSADILFDCYSRQTAGCPQRLMH